jgi:hypothetical protein
MRLCISPTLQFDDAIVEGAPYEVVSLMYVMQLTVSLSLSNFTTG